MSTATYAPGSDQAEMDLWHSALIALVLGGHANLLTWLLPMLDTSRAYGGRVRPLNYYLDILGFDQQVLVTVHVWCDVPAGARDWSAVEWHVAPDLYLPEYQQARRVLRFVEKYHPTERWTDRSAWERVLREECGE